MFQGRYKRRAGVAQRRTRRRRVVAARTIQRAFRGRQRTSGYYGRFRQGSKELKFHDLDIDDAVVAAGGTIAQNSVNLIAQGVTESTRVGRKCVIKSINWRFQVTLPAVADGGISFGDTVRVILYQDKQANGAAATVTGILESSDFQSFNNLANKSRFHTLMDRVYSLQYTASGGNGTISDTMEVLQDDTMFKECNIPLEFDGTTGAITEIRSNNIGVLLLSNRGTGTFNSKMRLRFLD